MLIRWIAILYHVSCLLKGEGVCSLDCFSDGGLKKVKVKVLESTMCIEEHVPLPVP